MKEPCFDADKVNNTLAVRLLLLLVERGVLTDDDYADLLWPSEGEVDDAQRMMYR